MTSPASRVFATGCLLALLPACDLLFDPVYPCEMRPDAEALGVTQGIVGSFHDDYPLAEDCFDVTVRHLPIAAEPADVAAARDLFEANMERIGRIGRHSTQAPL
jgi:hypothetical protein